ncbi:hypothetical protein BGW41_005763, partial [Actinomortierella wolfii]
MNFELDILAQQALLNSYTLITFAYPTHDGLSLSTIVATLQSGLERLTENFPWIAGQVVSEGLNDDNSGVYKVVSFEKYPLLIVKDLQNDSTIPSFTCLATNKFPYSAAIMDEGILSPRRTLPFDPNEPKSRPVFLVQATFIQGGLLLTIAAHHMTMDMKGQGQIMKLLSRACRNESFTNEEIATGNMARGNVIPLLDSVDRAAFQHQVTKQTTVTTSNSTTITTRDNANLTTDSTPPPKCTWAWFSFDASSLGALKHEALLSVLTGFISTDDALSALIWQSILRARLPRLESTKMSTLARAVEVRRALGIPDTYPGVVINVAYSSSTTIQQLVDEPLGMIASKLRSELDEKQLAYVTKGLVSLLHEAFDKRTISVAATLAISSTDLSLSSWGKINCYDLDFNLGLGKPVAVRRPKMDPFEGLIYMMPKTADGDVAVAICLRDDDMERLKEDSVFTNYG